jgi:hypothetical protein
MPLASIYTSIPGLVFLPFNAAYVKGAGCFVVDVGHGSSGFRVQSSKVGRKLEEGSTKLEEGSRLLMIL